MSENVFFQIDSPSLLEFRGPDASRFLNGQITQDVRKVAGGAVAVPSCVTDAKGRLQFRVWITESPEGNLWVEGPKGEAEAIEARLTRYLIADEVEVIDRTGTYLLFHILGDAPKPNGEIIERASKRMNEQGRDWYIPTGSVPEMSSFARQLETVEFEMLRVSNGVPVWGREIQEGILPPEAGLDSTDISYQKGCYIGQEVISRIKSAGKVNKKLALLQIHAEASIEDRSLTDEKGSSVGAITSFSPLPHESGRAVLAYIKRGAERVFHSGIEVEYKYV
jgi:tRNA-modifying protein YgfZ